MAADEHVHDVVVVGAGITGSIIAKELAHAGMDVLVLEAGTDLGRTWLGYQQNLRTFYGANIKTPESPYGWNPNAPSPDPEESGAPGAHYFTETGPVAYASTYARVAGGTTMHWMGTCLRMLPQDFAIHSNFGRGRDWPLDYADLAPDYERAEWEIGVAGDVADQAHLGVTFREGYQYPMKPIPPSFSDRLLGQAVDGMAVPFGGEEVRLLVRNTPAGRNSEPWDGYRPRGAVDLDDAWGPVAVGQDLAENIGERCQGNTACVPICPVQAKYNALKTLADAVRTRRVEVRSRAVASRVLVDGRRVTGIEYRRYESPDSPRHTKETARGHTYVLACHAVENAKLLLLSGLPSTSDQVGRNLHDHPTVLVWGLAPQPVGSYRGPLSSSGIEDLRGGAFRREHAAFRLEIGNDGWLWPTGGPVARAQQLIEQQDLLGGELRRALAGELRRHVRFGMLVEQLPDPANRVTLDPERTDALGLPVPAVHYDFDDYTLDGMVAAQGVAHEIFRRYGVEDRTDPNNTFGSTVAYDGTTYVWDGAGHYAGTHLMGADAATSVVDAHQRAWDQDNLHVAGPGSMPNMGTSNPTLTVAALAFRTARDILERPRGRG
ncbi:MAG: GMC family oxidoreductase [Actinomycetota bacterium]|nr:GMC family oxidoreductase [Actinomycetota bacterium]